MRTIYTITNMHRKLATSVTRAEMAYYDRTPLGMILARFTNDLGAIEGSVLSDCHWVLEGIIDNIFIIIVVSTSSVGVVCASMISLCWMFWVK